MLTPPPPTVLPALLIATLCLGCQEGGPPGPGGTGDLGPGPDLQGDPGWRLDPQRPLSTVPPAFPAKDHPLRPSARYGAAQAPLPTNSFFQNLVLGAGDNRVALLPYQVKALAQELAFAVPAPVVQARAIITPDKVQLRFGAAETFAGHRLRSFDALTATLSWTGGGATMEAPLALGAPYVSVRYQQATPRISPGAGVALLSVNGASGSGAASGARFELRLNDGSTWLLYASPALNLTWTAAGLSGPGGYSGLLRAALLPAPAAAAVLDAHAGVLPTAGSLAARIDGDMATVQLQYQREGSGPLLLMAMPHHLPLLQGGQMEAAVQAPTSAGTLTAVSGEGLTLRYALPRISFSAPRPIDPARGPAVLAALRADKDAPPAASVESDPYFGGKQLGRLARLALIADELNEAAVAAALRARLRPLLERWLDGQNQNPLIYDRTYGGVVTQRGLADPAADFGQGYYNDHHFHYGYFIYAAAALARGDADFRARYADKVLWLVRDIANPSAADPAFPVLRHFDCYAGHSWAAGLFAFGDNRNQESTSEAVNAWYAVQLFGEAIGHRDVQNLGRLLLGMEIASAQTYWQVQAQSPVYAPPLRDQHIIGVRWSSKADVATFFGANLEYVYGIQILPVTPITEALLNPAWVRDASAQLLTAAQGAQDGWKGILHLARAGLDREGTWAAITALQGFDDGNTRTSSLYHVATR